MERENSRRRTRRKPSSPLKSFWYQKGRRYCAMLLSFCLILGNTAGTAFAAGTGEEAPTFLITRADLYEALQKAAAEGKQPEENLSFQGDEELQKAYQDLLDFDLNADLYELKPEIKQDTKDMELRIFACLDQGVDPEKRYVIAGDEKIIFLVTNKTGQEQEATIQVDKKRTEPISILPGTALIVEDDGPEAAPGGNGAGAGSGGAANQGGGSGSGGGAAEKTESQEAATEKTSEEAASPDDGKGGDSIKPEDSLGDQVEPEDKTENKGDNPSGQEEASRENETPEKENPPKEETKKEDQKEPELEQEGGTEAPKAPETDNTKNESDNNKEEIKADGAQDQGKDDSKDADSTDKGEPEKKDDSADKSDAGQGEPEKKDEALDKGEPEKNDGSANKSDAGQGEPEKKDEALDKGEPEKNDGSANKSDAGQGEPEKKDEASDKGEAEKKDDTSHKSEPEKNEGASDQKESERKEDSNTEEKGSSDEKEVSLSVSLNQVQRVASIWGKKASSSNGTSVKKKTASGSNASPSNADQLLEGEAYETILLEKTKLGAAAFVTTASALGLDDDSFKLFTIYENNELKDVTVRVAAEPGDLPDNVTLRVKELEPEGENADQYRDAEEALKNEGAQYDGMMALDISFIDPDGNEVEPRGDVQVSIKVNAERLPEEVNPESLSVQHLKEEADGSVQVNQVADVTDDTDGIVEVNQDEAVAEFSVESFSTFTISWKSGWGTTYFDIKLHYVNTLGDEITVPTTELSGSITDGQTIVLSEYAKNADTSLTYKGAHYKNYQGEIIDQIQAGYSYNRDPKLDIKNANKTVDTLYCYYRKQTVNVYLVFETSDVTDPPEVTTKKELKRSKTVTANDDGTYDLNLSVSGAVGSSSTDIKMDILLIVDKSGSMNNGRIGQVANAARTLTTAIEGNKAIDARYSVVSFSNRQSTTTNLDWSNNADSVYNAINRLSANGGTNYQAGIVKGKEQLRKARNGAQTIVIFLTDGLPTYRNDSGNGDDGNGSSDNYNYNINAAIGEIKGMNCTSFYAIGFGSDFNNANSQAVKNLDSLCNNVGATDAHRRFTASQTNELNKVFGDISADATTILCDNVEINDTLSTNVQVVKTGEQIKKLEVTVVDKDGNAKGSGSGALRTLPQTDQNNPAEIKAVYDEQNKQVKLEFPSDYKLEDGWTYTVTTTIDATEAAYEKYRDSSLSYTDHPDKDTGTHADNNQENGLYSNDNANAVVTYQYNGKEETVLFDKPVIRIQPGKLVIQKTIEGLTESQIVSLANNLEFTVNLTWTDEEGVEHKETLRRKLSDNEFKLTSSGVYQWEIDGLSPNTAYVVAEANAEVEEYDLTVTPTNDTGTVGKGMTETAAITNTYTKNFSLTVKKEVTGNMGEKNKEFTFSYIIYDKDGKEIGRDSFKLTDGGSQKISSIPSGGKVEVKEEGADDYTTESRYQGETADLPTKIFVLDPIQTDSEVVFINHKSISTPTGLSNHKRPYIWMLAMAAIGLMGFSITGLSEKARKVRDEE